MAEIRVALLPMTPRLRDILTSAVRRERDMELVDWSSGADRVRALPDVVVGETEDPLDEAFADDLLRRVPGARLVLVADRGDRAAAFELRPVRRVLDDLSLERVIDAIRHGVSEGC